MEPGERSEFSAECKRIFDLQADGRISRSESKQKFFNLYAESYGRMSHEHPEYFTHTYDVMERSGNAVSQQFGMDLSQRAGRELKSFEEAEGFS